MLLRLTPSTASGFPLCHRSLRTLPSLLRVQTRAIQISTDPSSANVDTLASEKPANYSESPDATFDIIASSDPLLSVSLSPSQHLFTRRGTLVGVSGKTENTTSTLSVLEPFRRAVLRIPFLYQRVVSTTPIKALISTKSSGNSFAVVHLDGTLDWMLAGKALLAWTGQTLSVRPTGNRSMSLAHWGNSQVTGRGLVALSGKGSICELNLKAGENYVVHPGNVVAYTMNATRPSPYRLKSTTLRFEVPSATFAHWLPDIKFLRVMRESHTWVNIKKVFHAIRTWSRRTIWGDRLFLQFHGPTTILLQTRAARLRDVFSNQDVDEVADAAPAQSTSTLRSKKGETQGLQHEEAAPIPSVQRTRMSTANVRADGTVAFESVGGANRSQI